jgi:hypothetical protein
MTKYVSENPKKQKLLVLPRHRFGVSIKINDKEISLDKVDGIHQVQDCNI